MKCIMYNYKIIDKLCKFNHFHFNIRRFVNVPSVITQPSNTSSEFVTVTPDIALPTMDPVETINQLNQSKTFYAMPSQHPSLLTGSSLVTPETGFHFLFTSEQTVDLTDESQRE